MSNESITIEKDFENKRKFLDKGVLEFIKVIQLTVSRHGTEKVTNHLQRLDIEFEIRSLGIEKLEKFICDCVVKEFSSEKVSRSDIFGKNKRGEVTTARTMFIILLKQFIRDFSDKDIARHLGRTRQVVFYAVKEYRNMNPKHKNDADFLNRLDSISRKVLLYIEENII